MTKSGVWADTPQRLLTVLIGLPIVLGIVFLGAPLSTITIIIIATIAIIELYTISHVHGRWIGFFIMGVAIYIVFPMSLLIAIRDGENGLEWTLLLFFTNWGTDTFALLGGRMFGKRKLAPKISAGKTWEGAEIGFISGCCAGWIVGLTAGLPFLTVLIAPPIVSIMTILGDLLESRIKRLLNAKDSSHLLPGHGGFLDRIDGLLLAIPIFYIIIKLS
ncbi:MAG: phosphatidate cytidylyltransferase [Anaerolineae bacterium]|jgi:phosphatidate cytidylyltransferase|nr:phosphatidate cytidylyltransferase [Anaerolineae bacterium]